MRQKLYAKNLSYIYIYSQWKKIRGLDKDDPVKNTGQIELSFKEFVKKNQIKMIPTSL